MNNFKLQVSLRKETAKTVCGRKVEDAHSQCQLCFSLQTSWKRKENLLF